jgi:hypothetical protein
MLKVYGHWYTSTCDGTGGHESLKPLPPVRLTLTLPGGEVEHLVSAAIENWSVPAPEKWTVLVSL